MHIGRLIILNLLIVDFSFSYSNYECLCLNNIFELIIILLFQYATGHSHLIMVILSYIIIEIYINNT